MPSAFNQLSDVSTALEHICAGLEDINTAQLQYRLVDEDGLPAPYRQLLAHRQHMTSTLRNHYAADITLNVLEHGFADGWYRRVISLSLHPGDAVVELGIVAMDMGKLPEAVQDAIRLRNRPLGDILCESNLMREITPHWYLRLPGAADNLALWGADFDHDIYGRVGVIHVDRQPAIELLEIVTGAERRSA